LSLSNLKSQTAPFVILVVLSPIAETAIVFLLAVVRGVGFASCNRRWEGIDVRQIELRGLTMRIIGLGVTDLEPLPQI